MKPKGNVRIAVLMLMLGLVLAESGDTDLWMARFSTLQPGNSVPAPWRSHHFPKIPRHTLYQLVEVEQGTVLKATSNGSASALIRKTEIDPLRFPYLEWSWKVEKVIEEGQWREKKSDDFAARLFVIFEKPHGVFSFFGKMMMMVEGGLPGRTLNYVWANSVDPETFAFSPYTDQVTMIAVESGNGEAGRWRKEHRNIREDFRKAFGREPGKIIALGLMTDTDNTHNSRVAYYGDISFMSDKGR